VLVLLGICARNKNSR